MQNPADTDAIPVVSREEFDRIECNRCGQCCERLYLPGPLQLSLEIGRYAAQEAEWPREAIEALGLEEEMIERRRLVAWWSALEPTGAVDVSQGRTKYEYSCSRLARLDDGTTYCTAYEERPSLCRAFPNGRPMNYLSRCAWNVRIRE